MARPSVAIRLATEGKAQVKNDFAEIAQAGDATTRRLVANYDEQARAAEAALAKAARTAEKIASIAPQSDLQALITRNSGTVAGAGAFDGARSGGNAASGKSARDSAAALKDLLAEQERMESQARSMISAIDPLFAAQVRYDNEVARATTLHKAGFLSADRYAQILRSEEAALEQAGKAGAVHEQSLGARRAAYQQLSYQIGDVTQQLAMGVNPAVVFGQQFGQIIQALQLMDSAGPQAARSIEAVASTSGAATSAVVAQSVATDSLRGSSQSAIAPIAGVATAAAAEAEALGTATGASTANTGATSANSNAHRTNAAATAESAVAAEADAVAQGVDAGATNANTAATTGLAAAKARMVAFLSGPWGAAVIGGVTVLGLLASKMDWANDAVGKATKELIKQAKETETNRAAQERFKHSMEGVRAAILDAEHARKESIKTSRTEAEQANIEAKNQIERELRIRKTTKALIEQTRAQIENSMAILRGVATPEGRDFAAQNLPALQQQLDDLMARGVEQGQLILKAEAEYQATRADLADEAAKRAVDPVERIKRKYEGPDGLIEQAKRRARAEGQVTAELTKQIEALRAQMGIEVKAAQASQRGGRGAESTATDVAYMKRFLEAQIPGVQITSTTDHSKYVKGTKRVSDHHVGRAIDFVPPGGMDSMTKDDVRQLFEAHGVRIRRNAQGVEQLFGPGDPGHSNHFHVAWTGGAPSPNAGQSRADSLRRDAEAMEASAKGALALAEAYLTSGEAAVRAEAQREGATDAIRKGAEAEAQVRRQLNLDVAEGAAQGAKAVAQMRGETDARRAVNDGVSSGAIAVADMNRVLGEEAVLRPLLKLQALAQGDALATLTKVIDAYRKALADAHAEEARGEALAAIDAAGKRIDDIRASIPLVGDPRAREVDEARRAAIREADAKGLKPTDIERTDLIDARVEEVRAQQELRRAEYIADANRNHADSIALLERELDLRGLDGQARERSLKLLDLELQLNRDLGPEHEEQIRDLLRKAEAEETLRAEVEKVRSSLDEARQIGEDFVDTVFDPRNWKDWGDLGKRILDELAEDFIRLAILNPIKNEAFGQNNPTLSSVFAQFGSFFGGSSSSAAAGADAGFWDSLGASIGSNAMGTEYWRGGWTKINENGDELIELPRGSKIKPAAETRRLLAAGEAGVTVRPTWNIDARGADSAAIMRLERMMTDYSEQFGENVVAAVNDGISR
ncbi:MAG: hypothetical protein ABWX67_11035, partial [Allosphingosinicella sp.]